MIIERSDELIEDLTQSGKLFVKGDAGSDESLQKAGVDRAAFLITTLPSDADNLYVVLSARQQNSKLVIISRAS